LALAKKKDFLIKKKVIFSETFCETQWKNLPDKNVSVSSLLCSVSVILLSATDLTFLMVYFKD